MDDPNIDWFYARMSEFSGVFSHPSPNEYLASLSEPRRCLFYVGCFLSKVDNGDIAEYLLGSCGDDAELALHFLSKIGEVEIAKEFSSYFEKLPAEFHSTWDRDRREEIFWGGNLNDKAKELNRLVWDRSDAIRKSLGERCQVDW